MLGAVVLLLSVFLLGLSIGNRLTIYLLNTWIRDLDQQAQVQRLKELTGYSREQD